MGVPAALAWGMEGLQSRNRFFPDRASRPAGLATSRTTQEEDRLFRPSRKLNRTPDNVIIVPGARVRGTRLVGSFVAVLSLGTSVLYPDEAATSALHVRVILLNLCMT